MLYLLNKLFVHSFYKANASFFLFFFFIFFGAVQGGSLVSYHLSLMNSILSSGITLSIVLFCWVLYQLKCVAFILKIINSEEAKFMYNLQTLKSGKQYLFYTFTFLQVYAPVLVYSLLLCITGFQRGYSETVVIVILFQVISFITFTSIIFYRLNNWINNINFPSFNLNFKKKFFLYILYHFSIEKKVLLLAIKALSLSLLYIVLVWNKGRYDNDSFMMFYLVILMTHTVFPYLGVEFLEKKLAVYRNLPISLFKRAMVYIIPYFILQLPELAFILYHADALPVEHRAAYFINTIASLFLLTAFLYSEAVQREEYLKASFGLLFFSIFALHIQAFWIWIGIQVIIGSILFITDYFKYEAAE